jgi:parallel beta-helix repeat protein
MLALGAALAWAPPGAGAKTLTVKPGGSIAQALDNAAPGDVVEVEPGTYHEALTVDTPDITLRGIVRGSLRPILDGRGQLNDGVIASGSPFRMTGFQVQHYKGNGVSTQGVKGVHFEDLVVDDTGLYGVYPVNSEDVTVVHCTVTRISDAGIYVGESRRSLVAYNEVYGNVAGIEIENTNDAEVRDNLVYDNTSGILAFVLPLKLQKEGKRTRIHRNWVVRNNTPNFGDPNSTVGGLPYGGGILVMGADDTVVENNWVKDNHSYGIGVIRLAEDEAAKDPELEPNTDRAVIGANYLKDNGTKPHESVVASYGRGADLAFDGTGADNCFVVPSHAVTAGAPLPACPEGAVEEAPAPAPTAPAPAAAGGSPAAGAAAGSAVAAARAADHVVHIRGMRFEPKHLTVRPGETVEWVNQDAVPHTVTSGEGMTIQRAPLDSAFLLRGDRYRHTFDDRGRFEYLCLPHMEQAPMREASVTVE